MSHACQCVNVCAFGIHFPYSKCRSVLRPAFSSSTIRDRRLPRTSGRCPLKCTSVLRPAFSSSTIRDRRLPRTSGRCPLKCTSVLRPALSSLYGNLRLQLSGRFLLDCRSVLRPGSWGIVDSRICNHAFYAMPFLFVGPMESSTPAFLILQSRIYTILFLFFESLFGLWESSTPHICNYA